MNNVVSGAGAGVYVENGTFVMSDGIIEGNTSNANSKLSGRSGGGVYVTGLKGVFRKTGGVISGNVVPSACKGSEVFVASGRESKARNSPAGKDITLDSDSCENWDEQGRGK